MERSEQKPSKTWEELLAQPFKAELEGQIHYRRIDNYGNEEGTACGHMDYEVLVDDEREVDCPVCLEISFEQLVTAGAF